MTDYRDVARQLPRPTEVQFRDFAEYIAEEHSWYKHLPVDAPGAPFVFYLDPNAGRDLLIGAGGAASYRDRSASTKRLHHATLLTDVYRERFGYLEYFTPAGSWILAGEANGAVVCTRSPRPAIYVGSALAISPTLALRRLIRRLIGKEKLSEIPDEVRNGESVLKSYRPPTFHVSDRGWLDLPEAMLQAGLVWLTAVIHPLSTDVSLWNHRLCTEGASELQWPEETGGRSTVENLRTIARTPSPDASEQIDALLDSERKRQKLLMAEAMRKMLGVLGA